MPRAFERFRWYIRPPLDEIPRTLFSAGHDLFRDQICRFVAAEIMPFHADWEKAGVVPRSLWLKPGAARLLCTGVLEQCGGPGGDFLFGAIEIEEMARAGATGPTFYLHSDIGGGSVGVMKRIIARSMLPDNRMRAG